MSEQRMAGLDARVRRLVADDWAGLRAARLAALAEAPYAFGSTLAREQAFDEELWRSRAGSGWTFGAFDGPAIVGLATALPPDDLPGDGEPGDGELGEDPPGDCEPAWHLVGMWVAPGCRGQGLADRLVEAVREQALQAGARTVTLWVTEVNDRARAFYRRLGFAPTGARQLVRPEEPDHWEEELALRLR
ncbi:MAG TPA: GNAT family N-acetyltransferase [Streptosporangiaceae bacterium]|jgi:ribosomal protein S18 acetylase RimI-like enzyme